MKNKKIFIVSCLCIFVYFFLLLGADLSSAYSITDPRDDVSGFENEYGNVTCGITTLGFIDIKQITWDLITIESTDKYQVNLTFWEPLHSLPLDTGDIRSRIGFQITNAPVPSDDNFNDIELIVEVEDNETGWIGAALVNTGFNQTGCVTNTSDTIIWTFSKTLGDLVIGAKKPMEAWVIKGFSCFSYGNPFNYSQYYDVYNYYPALFPNECKTIDGFPLWGLLSIICISIIIKLKPMKTMKQSRLSS